MNAPSFSSFPPSFNSFPDLRATESKADPRNKGVDEDKIRSRKHKHKDRLREHYRDRGQHKKKDRRDSDNGKFSKRKHVHSPLGDECAKEEEDRHARLGRRYDGGTPGLFVVDKAGDPMNVVYGGLHAGDIPRYRRAGYGNILGLTQALKIITKGTGGKSLEVGINGQRPSARYTDSHSFALLTATRTRQLFTDKPSSQGQANHDVSISSQADFIRLPSRRRHDSEEPLSTYRSIHPIRDPGAESDSDISSGRSSGDDSSSSESNPPGAAPRTAHQHALAKLEAELQREPTSLPTWFALLEETLCTIPLSTKSSLARARADIKLSVLDRAMRVHPRNKGSVELRVKWLSAGAEVWDKEKLGKEWDAAVAELGSQEHGARDANERNRIWEEWLQWRASSTGNGMRKNVGVEGIVEDAIRASNNMEGELAKVKVLWWIAVVLKGAGFSERAMAIFQAQVELSLNCPRSLVSKPLDARLDALEEFWEAEYPRTGEADARGWNNWEPGHKQGLSGPGSSSAIPDSYGMDVDTASDLYTWWAIDETKKDVESNMPKRADDGDDPYATILFSDLRSLLVDLTTPDAKRALRIAWLGFIGLHFPGFAASLSEYESRDDVWSCVHLAREALFRQLFPPNRKGKEREWDAYAGTIIAREKSYGSPFGCVKEWGMRVFGPLEGVKDGEGRMWEQRDVEGVDQVVIRRIFDQLRRKVVIPDKDEDEEWDVMAIAFEAAINIKSAAKLSRSFLSNARDSVPLWGAHARLERLRGRLDEARRIYDTALAAAPTYSSTCGTATLWWEWAEMEWSSGADERAKAVILRAAGVDPAIRGSIGILRARRSLEDHMRNHDSSGCWKEHESWLCLRALLEVLEGGTGVVDEAMALMEEYLRDFAVEGVARESVRVRMLLMGWKHMNVLGRQVRRRAVREKVLRVVQEDERNSGGANTAILGVFLDGEKGESVWGKVRALVGEGVGEAGENRGLTFRRRDKSVTRRVWEVWLATYERGRWEAEVDRVRNSLEVGVRDERTRASPILWRVYIELEIYFKELKRAKNLLFRAVSECPLVKELYLIAFGPLRSVFSPRELEGWSETMAERGVRMHRGLDEYVVLGRHEPSGGSEDESQGEEELEEEARSYRRLAPF